MNLVIVESPTKGKTIKNFLKSDYQVLASYGHVRDLPENQFGVEIEKDFQPKYVIPPKSKKIIQFLKKEVQKAKMVILACDEDREGEAIAWHLTQILNLNGQKPYQRIVFHEITKEAVEKALENPRKIDMNLVNAQQTRRILDRIVGYQLSPFLWKKVARGLSAGRVQSVAVRLIVERQKEIENFLPQEYWTIVATLLKKTNSQFEATLIKKEGKVLDRLAIKTKEEAEKIIKELAGREYKVAKVEKKEVKKNPLPPFTTSTLQQEAWQRFKFPAKLTIKIAQQLYEKGLTTYHRTDSLNLSDLSLRTAKKFIISQYGRNYWAGFFRRYKAKGRVQEAHEAIRPTFIDKLPEKLKVQKKLDVHQSHLYELIWRRFMACQMASALFDSTTVDIEGGNYLFRASGQILKFDGFLKIHSLKFKENELPPLRKGETLILIKLTPFQHFTQPPPPYSEATLIKALEAEGIGRPSTYAPIISIIQERNYIEKDEKKYFRPTEIGLLVNDLLVNHFPKIVDIKFTALMEENLDKIAQGQKKWLTVIKEFYQPFSENLKQKYQEISKKDLSRKSTKKKCPKCGAHLLIRISKFGQFYACSRFPQCRYTQSLEKNRLKIQCPQCQKGEIIEKRTKGNKIFYACNRFPKCNFALWNKPSGEKCPKCGSLLVEKNRKISCSNKECLHSQKK